MLPQCACGAIATFCTAVDDMDNAAGAYMCVLCAANERISNEGMDTSRLSGRATIPGKGRMQYLQLLPRRVHLSVSGRVQRLPYSQRKEASWLQQRL